MKHETDYSQMFDEMVRNIPSDGSDDPFAHYVSGEDMMRGMVNGESVMALCGKIWVPARSGEGFPVCPECKAVYDSMSEGHDDDE